MLIILYADLCSDYSFSTSGRTSNVSSKFVYRDSDTWSTFNDPAWIPTFNVGSSDPAIVLACGSEYYYAKSLIAFHQIEINFKWSSQEDLLIIT